MQTAGKDGTTRRLMDENISLRAENERLRAALADIKQRVGTATEAWHIAYNALTANSEKN